MNIAEVHKGMLVRYHPVIGEKHDGKIYEILLGPGWLGDEPVVWLKNVQGAVSCSAISPVEPNSRENERCN